LAFVIFNGPGYLDTVVEYFATSLDSDDNHFVDAATDSLLNGLAAEFHSDLHVRVVNLDKGPPYYHSQSFGAVAGLDQYLEPSEIEDEDWHLSCSSQLLDVRSADVWGDNVDVRKKIFGVSVHPEYGGWYAYRGLFILRGARGCTLERQPVVVAVEDKMDKKRILEEYNLRGDDCRWRDLSSTGHDVDKRYAPEEMMFFTEMNLQRRRRFLEMKADVLQLERSRPSGMHANSLSERWCQNPQLVDSLHSLQSGP